MDVNPMLSEDHQPPAGEEVAQTSVSAALARAWREASRLPGPRNIKALSEARARGSTAEETSIVVSFVGPTLIAAPHVFVDPGKRYDFRLALGLPAVVVVRPGIDARLVLNDLFVLTRPYPTLVDFDRKVVGSIVEKAGGGFKLWPRRRGSAAWCELFD